MTDELLLGVDVPDMLWCGTLKSTNTALFVAYLVIVSVLMLTPGPGTLFAWRRA
jgi:hypothetical protein